MKLTEALDARRTVRRFTTREVTRGDIETMLSAAVLAPNHRLTQPWRFAVLGPDARAAYGYALGARKAKKIENPDAAETMRQNVSNEHRALPAMIGVSIVANDNPEIAEEDYAAAMMAIQNIALSAVTLGLGTAIRSGAILNDPAAKQAMGVPDSERVIAMIHVGEPAEPAAPRTRASVSEFTRWVP